MVRTFGQSAWVASSDKTITSRSVTSCAGMTEKVVVVAHKKIGFLTGGRARVSVHYGLLNKRFRGSLC